MGQKQSKINPFCYRSRPRYGIVSGRLLPNKITLLECKALINNHDIKPEGFMKRSAISSFGRMIAVLGVLTIVCACAVTTQTTESSSNTVQNSTEVTSNFTSSTSPGADSGASAKNEQALAFSRVQLERIKTDMAVGGGEHLSSLATLLGVPSHNQPEFFALTKANFSALFSSDPTTAEELLARLDDQLDAHPALLR
jgi:hypothetical protein